MTRRSILWLLLSGMTLQLSAQQFVRDVDFQQWLPFHSNANNFSGAAWGDLNGDGLSDIVVAPNAVFFNNGDGTFTRDLTTAIGAGFSTFVPAVSGVSIADFDNDDDLDVFINAGKSFPAAQNRDRLYLNDGLGVFVADTLGPWNPGADQSWGSGFADFNQDGFVDLMTTHPNGFLYTPRGCSFFINQDGEPANVIVDSTYGFSTALAPYTIPYWSDYDMDGDQDLFIASGPGGAPGLDSIYKNELTESGVATLTVSQESFAQDEQDGQCYSFIDYDNDGDKDLFITNWSGAPNNFYENVDGNYQLVQHGFSYNNSSLTNAWGDVDNDGDLDVIISNHSNGLLELWWNEAGTFALADEFCNQYGNSGVNLADFNNDGYLDFYATGPSRGAAVYVNQGGQSNHFIGLTLKGNPSNRAAIGANVRAVATINGQRVSQLREVSAQNSFQGHHDLRQHIGLGDATSVDSLFIYWPSGKQEFYTDVNVDSFYTIIEGEGMDYSGLQGELPAELAARMSVFPNPSSDSIRIALSGTPMSIAQLSLFNRQGKLIKTIPWEAGQQFDQVDVSDLNPGMYFIHVILDNNKMFAKKLVKQ